MTAAAGQNHAYLLTIRPLRGISKPVYNIYALVSDVLKRISRAFDALLVEYVLTDQPYYHAHAVIVARVRIDYRVIHRIVPSGFHVNLKPLRNPSDIAKARLYVANHKPADSSNRDKSVTLINRYGNKYSEVVDTSDIEERLSRIEKAVESLAKVVEELAKKRTQQAETKQSERTEIDIGSIRIIAQKSRKGAALRIRFAPYVKPNKAGEYYIALSVDDLKKIILGLQSFANEISGDTEKKPRVRVERGFKA